jgi:hypothetical protein
VKDSLLHPIPALVYLKLDALAHGYGVVCKTAAELAISDNHLIEQRKGGLSCHHMF